MEDQTDGPTDDKYYTVDLSIFPFDTIEEADKLRDTITDLLCTLKCMEGRSIIAKIVTEEEK